MKHTKIIIAAILALTLTACSDTTTEKDTALIDEVTSDTVMTEETTAAETTTSAEVTTTAETETEEITTAAPEETVTTVDKTAAADGEHLTFSVGEVTVRLYDSDMYSYETGNYSEPLSEDKKLLEKAADSLMVYKRYNEFIDYKNYNEAAYAGKGEPPLIMDDYLDENGNAAAKLRWVFESDFNGDGHKESLLAISTAFKFTEIEAQNEFLVYINDKGEAVPVAQSCNFGIYEVLDYGDFKYIPIMVGDNNASAGTYIFDFDGTGFTEKIYAEHAYPVYDEATGRIYFTIQGYPDCCYTLNSKTLDYDKFDVSQEEFDEFYKNYKYED